MIQNESRESGGLTRKIANPSQMWRRRFFTRNQKPGGLPEKTVNINFNNLYLPGVAWIDFKLLSDSFSDNEKLGVEGKGRSISDGYDIF